MFQFNIKTRSTNSPSLLHFCRKQCSYTYSAHLVQKLGGGVGLLGGDVVSFYSFYLPDVALVTFPAFINISKLTWILLFPTDHCAAPGILSEAWEFHVSQGCCWELRSVVLFFCDIWSRHGCAGSTVRIVHYHHAVLI